jgi:hypothetical protein
MIRTMNKDDVMRLAKKPGLISGIHNYCDRWCEKCSFTSRCMNYAMQAEQGQGARKGDMDSQEFWDELSDALNTTLDLLRESAAAHGIDIDSLDMSRIDEEEERIEKEARKHPIAQAALAYITMTDKWLEDARGLFEQKELDLQHEAKLELPGSKPHLHAVQITDAVDVITWYHTMIYPKMMRALQQSRDEREWDEANGFPKDSDGSAKVALISIDRSIGAWGVLQRHFSEEEDSILNVLVHLERMRKAIEKTFPEARAFQRPGFDYMPEDVEHPA